MGDAVGDACAVAVGDMIRVAVAVGDGTVVVGIGVSVGSAVGVGSAVRVAVTVGAGVPVGIKVVVGVVVAAGGVVAVGVTKGLAVGVEPVSTTRRIRAEPFAATHSAPSEPVVMPPPNKLPPSKVPGGSSNAVI